MQSCKRDTKFGGICTVHQSEPIAERNGVDGGSGVDPVVITRV